MINLMSLYSFRFSFPQTESCGFVYIKETPLICHQLGMATKPFIVTDIDANNSAAMSQSHRGGISTLGKSFH